MSEIRPTRAMVEAAARLNEGPILIVYRDGSAIRMETDQGDDPYVWRGGAWARMPLVVPAR